MQDQIKLHAQWLVRAPLPKVFDLITDFANWPQYFPKVAESIRVVARNGNNLELATAVKSFGKSFPVKMQTRIIPGKGFVSDNDNPKFGTSGHEEFMLSKHPDGTTIDYTYEVTIHKFWLRLVARPLIEWFSMKYWEGAVVGELRKRLEQK